MQPNTCIRMADFDVAKSEGSMDIIIGGFQHFDCITCAVVLRGSDSRSFIGVDFEQAKIYSRNCRMQCISTFGP